MAPPSVAHAPAADRPQRFRVIPQETGMMLRNLVARRLKNASLDEATALIKAGGVYINKLRVRVPSVRVAAGERVTVYRIAARIEPLDLGSLRIVHRDEQLMVIDKPAGVPTSPTKQAAEGTLSTAIVHLLENEGVARPYVGVLHRLDAGASGLVMFTIRSAANKSLHQQFLDHTIERLYRFATTGTLDATREVDAPLRHQRDGGVEVVGREREDAQPARTIFEAVGRRGEHQLVDARLETGRTHQIRAHAAHVGLPLVGDARYGSEGPRAAVPLRLHAHTLRFTHPISGARLELEAALPEWAQPD